MEQTDAQRLASYAQFSDGGRSLERQRREAALYAAAKQYAPRNPVLNRRPNSREKISLLPKDVQIKPLPTNANVEVDWGGNVIKKSTKKLDGAKNASREVSDLLANPNPSRKAEPYKTARKVFTGRADSRFSGVTEGAKDAPFHTEASQMGPGQDRSTASWQTSSASVFHGDKAALDDVAKRRRPARRRVIPPRHPSGARAEVKFAQTRSKGSLVQLDDMYASIARQTSQFRPTAGKHLSTDQYQRQRDLLNMASNYKMPFGRNAFSA